MMLPCFRPPLLPLIIALVGISAAVAETLHRPNVVLILTDDQGWGDLSLNGNPNLQTPHIDSLARDGATFDNFYVCAVCSPTRAELLTGRYHSRMGVYNTSGGGERINLAERTIGDYFHDAGYATAAFGKWHSGTQSPYHPNSRGFEEFYGFCSGHWGNYFDPMLDHNGRIVDANGFIIDDLTDHAIDFIRERRDEPFFVYLPYNTPHSPMQVPDGAWRAFAGRSIQPDPAPANTRGEDKDQTRAALALCKNIDDNVGRLLAAIDEAGVADQTLVLFLSDNGPKSKRYNGGMRGRKGSVHEGGLRSPGLWRWPRQIAAGTIVDEIAGAIDVLPTLADLCGVPIDQPAGPIDGQSMAARLTDRSDEPMPNPIDEDRLIFSTWKRSASVRSQRYRYHSTGELYHIAADRLENHDVALMFPEITKRMDQSLRVWMSEVGAGKERPKTSEIFPVGHPDSKWTQLPARDASPKGQIKRSSPHPNSSFLTGWDRTSDRLTWDVDIQEAGRFETSIRYVGPPEAVGTQLSLTFQPTGGQQPDPVSATVHRSGDVSIVGEHYDRVPRTESYEKRWLSMSLGAIDLPVGPGVLKLSCPNIAGPGIEFRLLLLERLSG